MFPIPFTNASEYAYTTISNQISIDLLVWSHALPAIFGILFSVFLYQQTKKLSALYLLLLSLSFAVWSYLDLVTWSGSGHEIMFTWAILDIFSGLFTVFSYWFLYAFIKGKDAPLVHKLLSVILVLPIFYYILYSLNFDTYYSPEALALEVNNVLWYLPTIQGFTLLAMTVLGISSYMQATHSAEKIRILFATIGSGLFLSIFGFVFLVTTVLLFYGVGTASQAYNVSVYSLFGMPFFVGFLGYLIAKYQAFNLRLSQSIGLILLLMLLLLSAIIIA